MSPAYIILTIVLATAFFAAGAAKVLRVPQMRELARQAKFSVNSYVVIGILEIAAAAGLALGLVYRRLAPLTAAAATGLTLLMIGAIIVLLRAGNKPKDCVPASVFGVLSAVTIWLTLAV
jgi:uncharacterized membrane protein YphA (DoxX/SURF4 family)